MTELELYQFINDNNIEWHHQDNDGILDVIFYPHYHQIDDFRKLLSAGLFNDIGIKCKMKDGYFVFWAKDICDYYGINIDKVFIDKNK